MAGGAEFLKSSGVVGWNVSFLLSGNVTPVSLFSQGECSANHMERINSGVLRVETGSGFDG